MVLPLAEALLAALLAMTLNWLALIPWRRSRGAHWTERARRLYPARVGAAWNLWLIPASVFLLVLIFHPAEVFLALTTSLLAWVGVLLGTWPFSASTAALREDPGFPMQLGRRATVPGSEA